MNCLVLYSQLKPMAALGRVLGECEIVHNIIGARGTTVQSIALVLSRLRGTLVTLSPC